MVVWNYLDSRITNIEDFPKGTFGFSYIIENLTTGKIYIGRKQLFSRRKKKYGKKKIAQMPDKRAPKYEYIEKESDWLTYTGSNRELNDDIKRGDTIEKTILNLAKNKAELTYFRKEVVDPIVKNYK